MNYNRKSCSSCISLLKLVFPLCLCAFVRECIVLNDTLMSPEWGWVQMFSHGDTKTRSESKFYFILASLRFCERMYCAQRLSNHSECWVSRMENGKFKIAGVLKFENTEKQKALCSTAVQNVRMLDSIRYYRTQRLSNMCVQNDKIVSC